jgi:cytidine deaminase
MGVEGEPGRLCSIRGLNLEVSLPTGSLCAERNAIGSALVRFPQLKREDLQAVSVLSLDEQLCQHGPLGPCGSCDEWLKKMLEMNPNLQVIGFGDTQAKSIYIRPFSI